MWLDGRTEFTNDFTLLALWNLIFKMLNKSPCFWITLYVETDPRLYYVSLVASRTVILSYPYRLLTPKTPSRN